MRRGFAALAMVTGIAVTGLALADNFHFLSGPDVNFSGDTVTATGRVAGLGNNGAQATLAVDATAVARCRNHGGNIAPGQNPVTVAASGTQALPPSRNGSARLNLSVTAEAPDPADVDAEEAGCPNGNWTVTGFTVTVNSATLTIRQDGQTVFNQTYFP